MLIVLGYRIIENYFISGIISTKSMRENAEPKLFFGTF
jgi:hypothetical protein